VVVQRVQHAHEADFVGWVIDLYLVQAEHIASRGEGGCEPVGAGSGSEEGAGVQVRARDGRV
jgi:hypothetical protein